MKKQTTALALAAMLAAAMTLPAFAQQDPAQQQQTTRQTTTTTTTSSDRGDMGPNGKYGDPVCGAWTSGAWQANGRCPGYTVGPNRARVAGTITAVRGHLVTVQQSSKSIVIDDQPALAREMTGKVAVGRRIVAYGYWRAGNFYATQFM